MNCYAVDNEYKILETVERNDQAKQKLSILLWKRRNSKDVFECWENRWNNCDRLCILKQVKPICLNLRDGKINIKNPKQICERVEVNFRYERILKKYLRDGVVIGLAQGCGDRIERWARKTYYIALKLSDRSVISVAQGESGWGGSDFKCETFVPDYSIFNLEVWKEFVVESVKTDKITVLKNLKCKYPDKVWLPENKIRITESEV